MLKLELPTPAGAEHKVLCLGAHSDDIEIGCGGTILKLAASYPKAQFYWVVFSGNKRRVTEARKSFSCFLSHEPVRKIVIKSFKESFFPYNGAAIKSYFEKLKDAFNPDLILTHYRKDLHQDHRLICELTWNTFRDHLILEYEVPKYDGDFGIPNFFVELDQAIVRRKIKYILDGFESQKWRHWFDEETFLSTLRLRGMEAHVRSKYAEAFYCRKIVLA
jgi:LmbE family N-acetylglucosaminyl deacetylase